MDWNTLYCPNPDCWERRNNYRMILRPQSRSKSPWSSGDNYCALPWYCGAPFYRSSLVKNGSSHGQKQALCRECGASVSLRYGTAYSDLTADPAIFETAVFALAEGNSLRSTARIVEIDKDTACDWLHRAACHCRLMMLSLWQELPVLECQVDELWSFVHTQGRPSGNGQAGL